MEWMLLPLKRYADFSGRSRRKEYWMFFLFQFLVNIAFFALMVMVAMIGPDEIVSAGDTIPKIDGTDYLIPLLVILALWGLFWLGMLIPNAAVIVRRFHDQNIAICRDPDPHPARHRNFDLHVHRRQKGRQSIWQGSQDGEKCW